MVDGGRATMKVAGICVSETHAFKRSFLLKAFFRDDCVKMESWVSCWFAHNMGRFTSVTTTHRHDAA